MSKAKVTLFIFMILLCFIIPAHINQNTMISNTQRKDIDNYLKEESKKLFGIIKIPSLKLENPIYPINSLENQVDKNIQLLKTNPIVLASHSGTGPHAYFKNLNQLKKKDHITITQEKNKYVYEYFKKEEVKKTGSVEIEKYDFPYIVLITCSKTKSDIQEVYYAKLIENNKIA